MTPQEAITELLTDKLCLMAVASHPSLVNVEEIGIAISALEKQILKKPNYFGDGYADGMLVYDEAKCPVCECDFEEGMTNWGCKFCPDCGQALDWSDTE